MPTVLVADDDADHRELITMALQRFGYTVVAVPDAAAAVTAVTAEHFAAALLDVRMPGESGIELCRRLRADSATASLPIMLVSADVNEHCITAALGAGADDYLTKPFHRVELAARLDNLLLRRSGVDRPATAAQTALLAARGALYRADVVPAVKHRRRLQAA